MKKILSSIMLSSMMLSSSWACGPYRCESYFYNEMGAYSNYSIDGFELDFPIALIKKDQLGIILPNMSILYLWASYRLWSGKPLSKTEQELLVQAIHKLTQNASIVEDVLEGKFYDPNAAVVYEEPALYQWTDRVKNVLKKDVVSPYISTTRSIQKEKDGIISSMYFENCMDDAFHAASVRLQSLLEKYGPEHPAVLHWIQNQQRVFMNCSDDKALHLPDPLPGDADQTQKQDYEYQVASSYFYAMDYQKSAALFDVIAVNKESPDQALAAYLVLRSHYRNTRFLGADAKIFFNAFEQYQSILQKSTYADDTHKLVQRLQHHLNPHEIFSRISNELEAKSGVVTNQTLKDLVYLYKTEEKNCKGSDFLDWLRLFRAKDGYDASYKKWQETKSLPWLIACLQNVPGEHEIPEDLKKQVDAINPSSPAYLTVRYLQIQHALKNHPETARRLIEKVLADPSMPVSVHNRLKSLQISVAQSFNIFIDSILQKPLMDVCYNHSKVDLDFSYDHAVYLHQLNLHHLEMLMNNPKTPDWLKKQTASVLFVRRILLGKTKSAEKYLQNLVDVMPDLKDMVSEFASLKTSHEKEFLGYLLILKSPGLSVVSNPSTWREGLKSINKLDLQSGLGENWWDDRDLKVDFRRLMFLSSEDAKKSKDEWDKLQSIFKEGSVDYFSKKALGMLKKNPNHPHLPEMMHLCVRMSRFKQPAPESSYKVFKALHEHFKNSEYAKKTPYHYYTK